MTTRIAMWSGPRNLSTALMYSFGARADTIVVDEPFYAAYLHATGLDHPMRAEVLASQPTDPAQVVSDLFAPQVRPIFYQKQMAHHMVAGFPMGWLDDVTNVFLIRHPARVVASYARKREAPVLDDLGFRQQAELFGRVKNPLVIDATDIRRAPERMLRKMCSALQIAWDPAMLHWPRGGHAADGVWAAHWYSAVHRSTGFDPDEAELPELPPEYARLADAALPYYKQLAADRII